MEVMDRDFFSYFSHLGSCCAEVAIKSTWVEPVWFSVPVTGLAMLIYYIGSQFSTISSFLLEEPAGTIGYWWSKTLVVRAMK